MNTFIGNAQQGMEQLIRFGREHKGASAAAIAAGAGIGLYATYCALKPERHFDTGDNAFELIRGLDETVKSAAGQDIRYVVVGGMASAALMDPRTSYNLDTTEIWAPKVGSKEEDGFHKPQFREDNGTRADIDVIVFEIDPKDENKTTKVDLVRNALDEKYGDKLKIGVTGLHIAEDRTLEPQGLIKKALKNLKKDWVSDRVEDAHGRRSFVIADIDVELPDEYFEPWQTFLTYEDGSVESFPVFHPLIQVTCYQSRTCHGIRKRDVSKVEKIMGNIGEVFDGARLDWGKKQKTVDIELVHPVNEGASAAISFAEQKNNLRWRETRKRLGVGQAALLATRIATHRQLDTRAFFLQFGQGGRLYDAVVSRFSDEQQGSRAAKVTPTPVKKVA